MLCLVSGNESEAIIDVLPAGDSSEKSPSPVSEVINDVPLVATASVGAPPEPSGATAFPVKPYHPEIRKDTRMEMNMVLDSDKRALMDSDDSISSDDDSDYGRMTVQTGRRRSILAPKKWWFQEPAVRKNICVVVGAWFLVVMGIASFLTGIILEILYHVKSDEIVRGIIFFVVAVVLLLPSVYAVTHVYLAAKRVGRVRFSSVWFFR